MEVASDASAWPVAHLITLVRVIVLADTLQRSKGKFVSVERGVVGVSYAKNLLMRQDII